LDTKGLVLAFLNEKKKKGRCLKQGETGEREGDLLAEKAKTRILQKDWADVMGRTGKTKTTGRGRWKNVEGRT